MNQEVDGLVIELLKNNGLLGNPIEVKNHVLYPIYKIRCTTVHVNKEVDASNHIAMTPIAFLEVSDKVKVISLKDTIDVDAFLSKGPSVLDSFSKLFDPNDHDKAN